MSKNNKKQQYLITMEVTPETIRDFGIKKEDVVPAKIGSKIVSAIMIPTDDEKLYLSYMRPIWAEIKRDERSRRCIVSNGKGSLKRCEMDCKACKKMKDGAPEYSGGNYPPVRCLVPIVPEFRSSDSGNVPKARNVLRD